MAAIEIYDSSNLKIGRIDVDGADIGVKARNVKNAEFGEAAFKNTRVPWDIQDGDHVTIESSKITKDPKVKDRRLSGSARMGWRARARGPALPSFCPDCSRVFPSANYDLHGRMFCVWDAKDVCLECGSERAYLSEGYFDLVNDTVTVLRGPDITNLMVRRLRQLSKRVDSGLLDPGAAVTLAASIHPELGRVAEIYWRPLKHQSTILLGICGALITMYEGGKLVGAIPDDTVTKEVLEQSLRNHEELWEKRQRRTRSRVAEQQAEIDVEHGGAGAEAQDNSVAKGAAITDPADKGRRGAAHKKTRRLQQTNHRNSFGRSRTR